jgi:hypothetical protein
MNQSPTNETTPGELLANFSGRSLKSMIVFTLVVHAVLLLATSGSYIWKAVAGTDSSKLSESERIDLAVKETQAAMRRIAEEHGLKPQDLGSHFAAPAAAPKTELKTDPKTEPTTDPKTTPPAPEEPKSTIEKELKKAEPGPAVPADEDLFK